jgi:hypothetical protein
LKLLKILKRKKINLHAKLNKNIQNHEKISKYAIKETKINKQEMTQIKIKMSTKHALGMKIYITLYILYIL